ncbi:FKBP-type peptidyl-prolyl cis-trans isomerase [Pseudomonas aeruginosa]|uniref:FKBP-type peptidyl-prolyl cis-trans isomerase n=1 Tax=Pseudomonas aeruginosa TaxID=287 RepID=UPI00053D5EBA|nr:FKBP-type peptidyl-prolyl cis-trans isomerase [Pseudomonas aeruginosa]ELI9044293.1 FKBP-type peptidyl-prolyl cis-trans isomerase [Pseudomonas aeruginosa]MCS8365879.1 FKBP-type peptidyl-prolyl cis-trans isomerase [Pseudomonas aeruginosa]HBO4433760.1 FKBP-type peptidyl-prolyl cis-trans isomerase [Pseudomonas aeruginosa]HBP1792440.1 FKBP-type peptidyl-prolyl cis-trans isomerase [Pseudomonas aeruginosa]HCR1259605.1 FKBP-type peptidyl-prolyl cis-trans isomerase [Pseudomonas aeruginosa]
MPRRLFIGLFLLPLPLFAAPPKDELAYAVGARLGTRLQQEVPDLELSELLLGLRQAYRGEALEIPPERIEKLLLQHENATTETPRITPAEARFLANEKARFGVRELTGGVLVSELRRGQGNGIGAATQVHVRYRGLLADGQVFDQSESAEWFALDSVIEGWRTALRAMPVGARWRVVIPSTQAYGHEGAGDLIPPDAPLVFEIDLLGVR